MPQSGAEWRVTSIGLVNPGDGVVGTNPILSFNLPVLGGATRAEVIISRWGGAWSHERRMRINGGEPILIPDVHNTPPGMDPTSYNSDDNARVDVPLARLHEGENTLQGDCSPAKGVDASPDWGCNSAVWCIYFPDTLPHPNGRIVSPKAGATLGEDPVIGADVDDPAGIERVDFYAWYNGYDENGDGIFEDWHGFYHDGPFYHESLLPLFHVGTATQAPFQILWNTHWIPDNPGGKVKVMARIPSKKGVWYATDPVEGLSLVRPDVTVRLYQATGLAPPCATARGRPTKCPIAIPAEDDLRKAVEAAVHIRTWNGSQRDFAAGPNNPTPFRINRWGTPINGRNHKFSYNLIPLPPTELRNGDNVVVVNSTCSLAHGIELSWPGPAVTVRYAKTDRTPPSLFNIKADQNAPSSVQVTFSKPVEAASAVEAANYVIDNAAVREARLLPDGCTVTLTAAAPLVPGVKHTLTLNHVKDRAPAANAIPPDSRGEFVLDHYA